MNMTLEVGDRIRATIALAERYESITGVIKDICPCVYKSGPGEREEIFRTHMITMEDGTTFYASHVAGIQRFPKRSEEGKLEKLHGCPVAHLSGGITIVNFSSAHPFVFEDGTILGPCSKEHCLRMMLHSHEVLEKNEGGWTDIHLAFTMSDPVEAFLDFLQMQDEIDIILVPFPVLTAWKASGRNPEKMRVVRMKDRVNKIAYADRFCI